MRTAEEWATDIANNLLKQRPLVWPSDNLKIVKQIQLYAMKEGMRRAAKITMNTPDKEWCGLGSIDKWELEKAILSAAEQLTEKDL